MEVITGALPSLLPKLADLVAGEYNLQKGLKGEIKFLREELESMKAALKDISKIPADQLPNQDKIWARNVRELSYDIEDSVDKFMVQQCKGKRMAKEHGLKKVIGRSLDLLMQPKIRHKIATEIREIKSRVIEVHERRRRYEVRHGVDKPVTMDPRLFAQFAEVQARIQQWGGRGSSPPYPPRSPLNKEGRRRKKERERRERGRRRGGWRKGKKNEPPHDAHPGFVKDLVGIDEARDELINKIMIEENEVPVKKGKIVSIVGFGGLGKTTLANAVYKKIRARFEYCAFVSVSQTPDLRKLYKGLLYDLGQSNNEQILDERRLIEKLREFLQDKRYFVVVDDVWDISVWTRIRCALPDSDVGYTIMTTTRISDVAEEAGGTYKMKPLSLNNSRKLLYRRIFGNENINNNEEIQKCPDEELAEVSDKILKKCAGVPLAIITMASLLACRRRSKMEWYEMYNSIGTGLENNLDVENMRKILSFSYYELPSHLRTCMLYLSMFPEDFEMDKDDLIRMWVAEGFIQCEKPGKSLFELGESYFNELINRSMIQPIHGKYDEHGKYDDSIHSCRVHDMVLDLIRSLSSEENFVTILSNMDQVSPLNTVRRLSIQNVKESHIVAAAKWSLQHARSVVVFPSIVAQVPALSSYQVLRVLELKGCNISQANSLKGLGNLYHLRYLGLQDTHISQLPEEIRNLQFLQTLDVWYNYISCLPSSVVQLRNLMCLFIDQTTKVPNGIGNLSCLEELSWLSIDDSTINIIEELGKLTELRLLCIELNGEWNDKLLESLRKLQKIRELFIYCNSDQRSIGGLDTWVAPRHLRILRTQNSCWFSTLRSWLNPSLLVDLTRLDIAVREMHQVDLEVLGRLSALRYLDLEVDNNNIDILQRFIVGDRSFPCLVFCYLRGFLWPVVFEQGSMPRLRELWFFSFHVLEARGIAGSDGGLDMGFLWPVVFEQGATPSLQMVYAELQFERASKEKAEQAKAALRHAAEMHPNHPCHDISITPIYEDSSSESDSGDSDEESTEEERT